MKFLPFYIILLAFAIYLHCSNLKDYDEDTSAPFDTGPVWLRDTIPAVREAGKLAPPDTLLDEAAQRRVLRR